MSNGSMRTNKNIYIYIYNVLVICFFLLITILCTSYLFKAKSLMIAGDGYFHFSQAEEIYQNLRHGVPFTFIATHTFNNTGVGNFLFYPTVFLYPWAALRFMFSAITAYDLWYAGLLFGTFVIAYYCMRDYSHSTIRSISFAVLYGLMPYHLYTGNGFVLGEYVAYTFLPIVFLGFYHVFYGNYHKWPLLAIGMTLILYSHLLSAYMVIGIFILILIGGLFGRRWWSMERIISWGKSVVLTLLLSAWFFVPFLTDFFGRGVIPPDKKLIYYSSLFQMITASLTSASAVEGKTIGLLGIIIIAIGWKFIKNAKKEQVVYFLGILFFLAATAVIPYDKIKMIRPLFEIVGLVQLPCRFLNFASLFLATTGSLIVDSCVKMASSVKGKVGLFSGALIVILGYFISINTMPLNLQANRHNLLQPCTALNVNWAKKANVVVNNTNYNNIFTYPPQYGSTDYYLKQACNPHAYFLCKNNIIPGWITKKMYTIEQHVAFINGRKKVINPTIGPNKLTYRVNLKRTATVDLPVIAYHNTLAYDNGRQINKHISKRGTVSVRLRKGKHLITAQYVPNKLYFVAMFIAAITWVSLLVTLIIRRFWVI